MFDSSFVFTTDPNSQGHTIDWNDPALYASLPPLSDLLANYSNMQDTLTIPVVPRNDTSNVSPHVLGVSSGSMTQIMLPVVPQNDVSNVSPYIGMSSASLTLP
jgi:hypothetical protein